MAVCCSLIALCLLSNFPSWHEGGDALESGEQSSNSERTAGRLQIFKSQFRAPLLQQVVLWFTLVAAVMSLLSVFWQHLGSAGAATMVRILTAGVIKTHLGSVIMGLGWTTVVINVVVFWGVLVMILSIRVLSQLAD